jgi:hypothetical protein
MCGVTDVGEFVQHVCRTCYHKEGRPITTAMSTYPVMSQCGGFHHFRLLLSEVPEHHKEREREGETEAETCSSGSGSDGNKGSDERERDTSSDAREGDSSPDERERERDTCSGSDGDKEASGDAAIDRDGLRHGKDTHAWRDTLSNLDHFRPATMAQMGGWGGHTHTHLHLGHRSHAHALSHAHMQQMAGQQMAGVTGARLDSTLALALARVDDQLSLSGMCGCGCETCLSSRDTPLHPPPLRMHACIHTHTHTHTHTCIHIHMHTYTHRPPNV